MADSERKGKGLFNVEYLTVLILFIIFSTYFTFRMMEQKPAYIAEVQREIFRAESYRLSEMLINDPGHPLDWETLPAGSVKRIGLSDATANVTNLLNETKLSKMKQMCGADYAAVKRLVGGQHDFSLVYINSSGAFDICNQTCVTCDVKASITRFVAFSTGDYGKIVLQMW
jgi:hypothetical protein